MRPGPVLHGALLAAALGLAWQTWTRDRDGKPRAATSTVWPEAGAVTGLTLSGKLREVVVAKREGEGGGYLWATVKKRTPPPPRPAAPDGGVVEDVSVPGDEGTVTTTSFPVGEEGEKALARLAPLEAVRDLGTAAAKDDYGLGEESEKLSLEVGGTRRELVLGAKVFGGDDRYVLDPATGKVYVVAGEVLRPFDAAEFSLRERKLHAFAPGDVAEVVLRAGGKERALVRRAREAQPEGGHPPRPAAATWADAKTPDKPDQSLANFMDRVEQLTPTEYAPPADPAGLTPVATAEYRGKGGEALGTLELSKKPAPAGGQVEYYVKSGRTRGLAKANPLAAARVEQDLAQVLH
jgi:hypothetical protein